MEFNDILFYKQYEAFKEFLNCIYYSNRFCQSNKAKSRVRKLMEPVKHFTVKRAKFQLT